MQPFIGGVKPLVAKPLIRRRAARKVPPMRKNGFTLIEMMVTLTIAGILAGIAIPNMRTFLWNNRIATTANDLLRSIQVARTEAIKRQLINAVTGLPTGLVAVCATTNSNAADNALTCSYGNFSQWFVFVDANNNGQHDNGETVLDRGAAAPTNIVKSNQNGILCFASTGFSNPVCGTRTQVTAVTVCANSTARALIISQTGRARISSLYADVNTSIVATGSCP
jgi:type IV fimbrial biogenesis protein FimT